ncbi:MAG: ribosome-associated translation inhibitor RaiA [Crocinitomicaceae bacterium]|nr:ribosome-associated translation inhibitor RaiA [Crocinitomicaceae bacterium]
MYVQVQSIHFDADHKLVDFIKEKMSKLTLMHDQILKGEVFLRLDKSDVHENKVAEIKLAIPGKELFARKQCRTFEEAADTAVDALRRQIDKHKNRNASNS